MAEHIVAPDRDLQSCLEAGKRALIAAMASETHILSQETRVSPEDERLTKLYRIVSGWALCRRLLSDGRSQIVSVLVPGDMIGVQSLLTEQSPALIEPREVIGVQSIGYSQVLSLAAENSHVALWLLWSVNEETRRRDQWLTLLARGTALQKVSALLLDLHRRVDHVACVGNAAVRVPLTQREIAEHLGLALADVTRALAILRERGGVNGSYGTIEIADPRTLMESAAEMADFCENAVAGAALVMHKHRLSG